MTIKHILFGNNVQNITPKLIGLKSNKHRELQAQH